MDILSQSASPGRGGGRDVELDDLISQAQAALNLEARGGGRSRHNTAADRDGAPVTARARDAGSVLDVNLNAR